MAFPDLLDYLENGGSSHDLVISNEFLAKHGIFSIEDAPDELIDAADKDVDSILGKDNDN